MVDQVTLDLYVRTTYQDAQVARRQIEKVRGIRRPPDGGVLLLLLWSCHRILARAPADPRTGRRLPVASEDVRCAARAPYPSRTLPDTLVPGPSSHPVESLPILRSPCTPVPTRSDVDVFTDSLSPFRPRRPDVR